MSFANDTKPSSVSYANDALGTASYSQDTKPTIDSSYLLWDVGSYLIQDTSGKIIIVASTNSFTNDSKP